MAICTSVHAQEAQEQFVKWLGKTTLTRLSSPLKWDPDPLFAAMDTRAGSTLPRAQKLLILDSGSKWAVFTTAFWDGNDFKQDVFRRYVERLTLVPAEAEAEWGSALSKLEGVAQLEPLLVLGPMVMQDKLFAGDKWQPAEAERLLVRLKSLTPDAVVAWAQRRDLDKFTAAVSLVRIDALFTKDVFEPGAFAKLRQ